MGYLRRPSYYKKFKCIASACTDTCCAGWEIDIDEETLEKYRTVTGSFAKRLWSQIELPGEDEDEPAHFRLGDCDRCPFLNEKNLCDIYSNLGEEYLSYICTHHPRFYEWYVDGKEAGLGLVCEAAAELILQKHDAQEPSLEVVEEDEPTKLFSAEEPDTSEEQDENKNQKADENLDEDLVLERKLEQLLFSARESMFDRLKTGESLDITRDWMYDFSREVQKKYDAILFGEIEDETSEPEEAVNGASGTETMSWSRRFWIEDYLNKLLEFYQGLELNDQAWWDLLGEMKAHLSQILENRRAFLTFYQQKQYEYNQLLEYFIYRYFMKARLDGEVRERVAFALISTAMIELAGIWNWMQTGTLGHDIQIGICKMYAKEIEYDEGNVDEIAHYQEESRNYESE